MKKILVILISSLVLFSCVSQADYDTLADEKDIAQKELEGLKVELDRVKIELEEFKMSPSVLMNEVKEGLEKSDFTSVKNRINILVEKHPDATETREAKAILANLEEEEDWQKIISSESLYDFKEYANKYPQGKYFWAANKKISEIKILNEKKDYEEAINSNSSSKMKAFLANYPNHPQSYNIQKKIIQTEVREIKGDSRTGKLPQSQQLGNGYSANSTVTIRNDTGCTLTVRYSGSDVKSVTISSKGSATIYLKSGSYDIASTACDLNYAGSEQLQGQYSSSYYIVTSRF
jgi:hypothetical protein